jgi:thioredoxin reductase (NADPH)
MIFPCVIVGSGMAGLTCANYLLQANINCLILEGPSFGGALTQSTQITNWPSELSITGEALMKKMGTQVLSHGAQMIKAKMVSFRHNKTYTILQIQHTTTGRIETIQTYACILAMGSVSRRLHVPGEDLYWGKTVSNCAACDGFKVKDKRAIIVGAGDTAFLEASHLLKLCSELFIFIRGSEMRAKDKQKIERLRTMYQDKLQFWFHTSIQAFPSETSVVISKNGFTERLENIAGTFLAIGYDPNTDLLCESGIELDEFSYIKTNHHKETSLKGVYAIGDIADPEIKQAITASADGCIAALHCIQYLDSFPELLKPSPSTQRPFTYKNKKVGRMFSVRRAFSVDRMPSLMDPKDVSDVIDQYAYVVFVITGPHCSHCLQLKKNLRKLMPSYEHKIQWIAVDAYSSQLTSELKARFKVAYKIIPVMIMIRNQSLYKMIQGSLSYKKIQSILQKYSVSI